jgi:prepilin-type N-terminal cleavage/methylation domain-containing protein
LVTSIIPNLVVRVSAEQAGASLRAGTAIDRGFSLLELVLVLAIIATLTAIAAPRYQGSLSRYRADLTARRIFQDLELAQVSAKAKGAALTVRIRQGTDELELFDTAGIDPHENTYCTRLSEPPYRADIATSTFGGDDYIMFDGWGLPDSGGTAVLTVGSETRTITVNAETGKATFE